MCCGESDLCWKLQMSAQRIKCSRVKATSLGGHTNRSWWSFTGDRSAGPVLLAAVIINRRRNQEREQQLSESSECSENH